MEHDAIERLAIDLAAGELNEDTEALFREYLAEHPEANKQVEDMLVIYEKTEAAIGVKTKHAVDTDTSIADIGTKPHSMFYWLPIARWAAVVIFAAFIGLTVGRWTKSPVLPEEPGQATAYPDLTVRKKNFDLDNIGGSFWRNKALAMFQAKPSMAGTVSITGPTLWEKYRQLIKERHYE